MTKKTKLWRYKEGAYGHTVTVYEKKGRRNLYISYWHSEQKRKHRECLGHANHELAIQQCREMSDLLRTCDEVSTSPEAPSFEILFELYHDQVGRHKKGAGPTEDRRRKRIWLCFLKKQNIVTPDELTQTHVDTFVRLRRHGDLQVPEVRLPDPAPTPPVGSKEARPDVVKPRTVHADLVFLNAVLNWAADKTRHSRPLIEKNPIQVPMMKTRRPKRPVATHDDYRDLLRCADSVDSQGLFGCFLRLLNDLGWRVTGVCHIRASDLDLERGPGNPYGRVKKNPWVDKEGCDDWVPLTRHSRAVFGRLLRRCSMRAGEAGFLFPAPKRPGRPWSRWHVRDLLDRAEKAAQIRHVGGAHSFRRKWATERKDHPDVDVMRAGGWNDVESLRKSYNHADPHTTYEVLARPTRRLRRT